MFMHSDLKTQELISAIIKLLNCTDLSVEELDQTSIEAIADAREVLKKYGRGDV
jgi:hypothetical protein